MAVDIVVLLGGPASGKTTLGRLLGARAGWRWREWEIELVRDWGTREQFLTQLQRMGGIAPNLNWKVEEMLQVGNRFVVRGRATATPVAPFTGAPSTGKGFEIMAIDIHTIENHQIVLSYHVEDWHGAIEQLRVH